MNGRFVAGHTGNPRGRPKDDLGVADMARKLSPTVIRTFGRIVRDQKAPAAARVSAGTALLDRAWGRAPGFSTSDAAEFKKAVELSDEELLRIARAGGLLIEGEVVSRETADIPSANTD